VLEVRTASPADLAAIATLVAEQQRDPTRHIGYLASTEDAIAAQLTELEPLGLDGTVIAVDEGQLVGVLAAEWDDDPPRVWWHGPVVASGGDWQAVADALDDAGRRLLPASVTEEEHAPDARHEELAAFAARHGAVAGEGSVVLGRRLDGTSDEPAADHAGAGPDDGRDAIDADHAARAALEGIVLRPFEERDRAAVAALHDALFPATHTPGHRIDEGADRLVWVAEHAGGLVGYVAAEPQEDGDGYVDFLGVTETVRGRGLGTALVGTACEQLRARGCPSVHLTVRTSNVAARRVYARCGFAEERELVPWRRGFTVA
jgi:ribosomal protein S18 acetylase RimI-like enzyme